MDKAKERFVQKAEEIKILNVPQCNKCRKNIDGVSCHRFPEGIPNRFYKNNSLCGDFDLEK